MKIAIYAFDGIGTFFLSVPQVIFSEVLNQGIADWETVVFSDIEGSVRTQERFVLDGVLSIAAVADADVLVIPAWHRDGRLPTPALQGALREARNRGAIIVGLCLGVDALAQTGLLTGRRIAAHWRSATSLRSRHPEIVLDEHALYIDDGDVLTAAGTAAGLDACLHMVRTHLGVESANIIARHLVIAPHREGDHLQILQDPLGPSSAPDPIAEAYTWAITHLGADLSIDRLASIARMSRRSFVRHFHAEMGVSPAVWVRGKRMDEACRLLETSRASVQKVAELCGFGTTEALRRNFVASFSLTPSEYRRRYDSSSSPGQEADTSDEDGGAGGL